MTESAFVRPYGAAAPVLAHGVYLAPSAVIVGDVAIDGDSSVWYGAVLRGDVGRIRIGRRTNVQDLSCIHMSLGISHAEIGDDVTIGHRVVIHGARVESGALIGIGAILLDNAVIGSEALVAAGSVVPAGMIVPPRVMVRGQPARVIRELREDEWTQGRRLAERYVTVAKNHRASGC